MTANKSFAVLVLVPSNADEDDCLTAAADTYLLDHPELQGYDLSPRWTDDDTRESITLTIPAWAGDYVTIEEMPDCLRGSHRAARNWGRYPINGATRRRVSREEADEIVAADDDAYDHIVEEA